MAGYLWQIRYALLTLLKAEVDAAVELETDDDVVLRRADGTLLSALQAKHSFQEQTISTSGAELWKTLRVWAGLVQNNTLASDTKLVLVLTGSLASDSPLSFLQSDGPRDPKDLAHLRSSLTKIATTASRADLKKAHSAWLALQDAQRASLLERVVLRSAQAQLPTVAHDIEAALRRRCLVKAEWLPLFTRMLYGWFDGLVDRRLGTGTCSVTSDELTNTLIGMRDDFSPTSLPSTTADAPHPTLEEELAREPRYLRQLHLLRAGNALQLVAVKMYHRGSAQRNDWLNSRLTSFQKLSIYDQELANNWEVEFAQATTTPSTSADAAIKQGERVYERCMSYRGGMGASTHTHVACGTYHILANAAGALHVGWHPHFDALLQDNKASGDK